MYTKNSETSSTIEVATENGPITFRLESTPQDFAACFVDANEQMIAEEKTRADFHAQMISDFDSDPSKIELFESLLIADTNTAFTKYQEQRW